MLVLFPAVLLVKRPWAARLAQLVLLSLGGSSGSGRSSSLSLNAVNWTNRRTRLALILGSVAFFTLGSGLLFSLSAALRERYGLEKDDEDRLP